MKRSEPTRYGCGTLMAFVVLAPLVYWIFAGVFRGGLGSRRASVEPARPVVWLENDRAGGGWVPVALDDASRDRLLRILDGNEAGESWDQVKLAKPPHGSVAEVIERGPRASRVIVTSGAAAGVTGWVPNDRIKP